MATRRMLLNMAASALLAAGLPATVLAQNSDFPDGPVTIVIPFSAGGGLDTLARTMQEPLSQRWGQPVVIENRPGAGGVVASSEVVRAEPDGKTIMFVAGGHALNELIYDQVPYDTIEDFTPIAQMTATGNVIIAPVDSEIETVEDVIAAANEREGGLSYGTAGAGTTVHLSGELFANVAGVPMEAIHYQGDSGSIAAILGGHIPVSFNSAGGALPQIEADRVRPIAVTSPERMAALPDVPTVAESGLPDYSMVNWWGVVGPAGIPGDVVEELNAAIVETMQMPEVAKAVSDQGLEAKLSSSEEFDALIRSEMEKWAPVIEQAGVSK